MNRQDAYSFLVRVAIPKVKKRARIPTFLNNESNLLWDSIYRAHLDVLSGRFHLPLYCERGNNGINEITIALYNELNEHNNTVPIIPRTIIQEFSERNNVEFGAIQKLVNMTFKYLSILKTYHAFDDSNRDLNFSPDNCDCPLDSIILGLISDEYNGHSWTNMSFEEYSEAQSIISNRMNHDSNLLFDFRNYQDLNI